ncbi:reverse transcriptase domain-containing protein [Tanacetum coccineum]|uniref:Reverse transcriptase domain-containing protein n=1 Tax=Tanacetum coccineum TaxID=301880 RepID=A0ABQ5I7N2_9ASTR
MNFHETLNFPSTDDISRQHMIASDAKFQLLANQMTKIKKTFNERPQGALPSNTIPNPKEDIKVITTQSGITFAGPLVLSPNPSCSSKDVERDPKTTMDQVHISSSGSIARVPSSVIQPAPASKSNEIPEQNPHQPPVPYPSRLNKAQMPKYAKMLKDLLTNKEKLLELANTSLNENCSAVLLKKLPKKLEDPGNFSFLVILKSIHPLRGSPTPSSDPVVTSLSPSLTPFGDSDFLMEETDAFLALDDSISPEIDNGIYDSEGDILFLEKILNDDPIKDLPPKELKNDETKTTKSSIEEPPELELKDLPPQLEYVFLEGTSKLPVIIAKDLKKEEKDQLLKRRVNLKIHEVIKAEVIKLLDARLIYPSRIVLRRCVDGKEAMDILEACHHGPTEDIMALTAPLRKFLILVLEKYGVKHKLSTSYHPQTSGQVEVSNRGLKIILERIVGEHRAKWADKLDDALWAFRTAFKTVGILNLMRQNK